MLRQVEIRALIRVEFLLKKHYIESVIRGKALEYPEAWNKGHGAWRRMG